MHALSLLACTAPLLDGEAVLGVDRTASFTYGGPEERLGAAVAARGAAWLASAPGAGATWRDGTRRDEASAWVGFLGESEVIVTATGEIRVDGAAYGRVADAVGWAVGPRGVLAATVSGLEWLEGTLVVPAQGVRAVAWGEDRLLAVVCEDSGCAGHAWSLDGVPLGAFAPADADGAVGEWRGRAWAGAPAWDEPEGRGRACAEDGACVEGLPGDHLGAAIGGGHTVGTFNKWIVPARSRIVPLEGGTVLALETGAEIQPIVLSGDGGPLVIGAPYQPHDGLPAGAVVTVTP